MKTFWPKIIIRSILMAALIFNTTYVLSQDENKEEPDFHGHVSVTNNGFSFIPSFSLGKPATIADLSVGGKRFSFDPQFTPIPGTTKVHRLKENIGAATIVLSSDDLNEIHKVVAEIEVQGARYPEHLQKRVGR